MHPPIQPTLDPQARKEMEQAYIQMLSAVVELARLLGKPCPIQSRAERLRERRKEAS